MEYNEIYGDLILEAKKGSFDVIAHGCNCFCKMSRGLAPQMAKAFDCDKFFMERAVPGDINKLGQIEYKGLHFENVKKTLWVVNAYTQYHWDTKTKPLDYEALTLCLRKINKVFAGKHIGLPLIGCHLAGGVWDVTLLPENEQITALPSGQNKDVKTIIQQELKDMNITIVHYKS